MIVKKRKKSKEENNFIIDRLKFIDFLENINLNGLIEECVLEINKKNGAVYTIDLTESLMVIARTRLFKSSLCKTQVGLTNVRSLIKFLKTISDTKINAIKQDLKLSISRKDKKRKIVLLLNDPEVIPVIEDKENVKDNLKKMQCYSIKLDKIFINDLITYIKLSETKKINIKVNKNRKSITFICGEDYENKFIIQSDSILNIHDDIGDFIKTFNSEILLRILSKISSTKEEDSFLYVGKDAPLLIEYKYITWALTPLSLEEG